MLNEFLPRAHTCATSAVKVCKEADILRFCFAAGFVAHLDSNIEACDTNQKKEGNPFALMIFILFLNFFFSSLDMSC